jgi:HK97 family phage prohead protease
MASSSNLERRAAADISIAGRRIFGYAVVFNSPSGDLGGFYEEVRPEAVDRTLRERLDVRALVDHDTGKVIGRTTAGTLRLAKDERGLRVEIDPPETTAGRDIIELVQRGDVTGMSFTFRVMRPHGERFERRDGQPVRILTDLTIQEISIVTFPAYEATDVQVAQRSLLAFDAQHGRSIAMLRRQLQAGA